MPPSLLITGATASTKGSAQFGSFAAGKFALRALGQSLAREFGPRGVHVAHAIIDGVIDIPRTKHYVVNEGSEDGKIDPRAVCIFKPPSFGKANILCRSQTLTGSYIVNRGLLSLKKSTFDHQ